MAAKTRKTTKKTTKKAEQKFPLARDLWLAGLGVYGRVYDETVDFAENARTDINKLFDQLVDRGATVESDTRKALKDARIDTDGSVEERLEKLRDALPSMPELPKFAELEMPQMPGARIRELEAEVEALTKKVNALSRAKAKTARKPRKAPAAKAPVAEAA